MNEGIKEILDYLKNNTFIPDETKRKYKILHRDEVKILLDYITNLQQAIKDTKDTADDMLYELKQENERLKEWKKDLLNENIELENIRKEAIEYLEHFNSDEICENITGIANNLLNILQNGSDNDEN